MSNKNIKIYYHCKLQDQCPDKKRINKKIVCFISEKFRNYPDIFNVELGIHFVCTKEMKILNQKHRNINKPTDVLSFPIYEKITFQQIKNIEKINLGDIFICTDIIQQQAIISKKNYILEIENIILHGLKHLFGIHHK
jgi:probable rRNA maturation factor